MHPVIWKGLEHLNSFKPVIMNTVGGRLPGPSHDNTCPVTLIKGVPVLCIPRIVERLH